MLYRLTVAVLIAVCVGPATHAAVTRVWEFGLLSAPVVTPLPIRVQVLTPGGDIRVFDKTGRPSENLSMYSSDGVHQEVAAAGVERSGRLLNQCHFTGEGSLVLVEPTRCGRPMYIQAFDADRQAFVGSQTALGRIFRFVVGPRDIAVLTDGGLQQDGRSSYEQLRIEVISRDGDGCKVSRRWETSSYTAPIAIDNNAAGDVAALVGKREGDATRCRLVVARTDGAVLERDIENVGTSSLTVAISRLGTWVAVSRNTRVAVYGISGSIETGPRFTVGGCVPGGLVWRLSVSDDASIAAAVQGKGEEVIVCARPEGPCEVAATYSRDDNVYAIDIRFFNDNQFYVVMTSRDPAKSIFKILRYD